MQSRRFVLAVLAVLPILALSFKAEAQVPSDAAKAYIQDAGQQLVGIVNGDQSTTQKADALRALVDRYVAVDLIGDYVLGRFRNVATPAQHAQFLTLFHRLLSYNITYQIKAYQGVSFTVNGATVQGNDTVVDTTVTRPSQSPADVGWVLESLGGSPKIVDVIVAGTSLRITTRNDYASVIINNGGQFSALLTAMQNQIDRIQSQQQ